MAKSPILIIDDDDDDLEMIKNVGKDLQVERPIYFFRNGKEL